MQGWDLSIKIIKRRKFTFGGFYFLGMQFVEKPKIRLHKSHVSLTKAKSRNKAIDRSHPCIIFETLFIETRRRDPYKNIFNTGTNYNEVQ